MATAPSDWFSGDSGPMTSRKDMVVDISTPLSPLSLPLSLSSLIPPPCAHVVKLTVSASLSDRVFF